MRVFLILLLALAPPALAACPPQADTADIRAQLHTQLLRSDNEASARRIANNLWQIWLTAPDEKAQALLDNGMRQRESFAFQESEDLLDELLSYCPDYAEAYNQRAFTRFMRNDFDGSLADIAKVLQRNPYHFGALSGRALNLMSQGRVELAQSALRDALNVHPYLRERAYLIEDPEKDI